MKKLYLSCLFLAASMTQSVWALDREETEPRRTNPPTYLSAADQFDPEKNHALGDQLRKEIQDGRLVKGPMNMYFSVPEHLQEAREHLIFQEGLPKEIAIDITRRAVIHETFFSDRNTSSGEENNGDKDSSYLID